MDSQSKGLPYIPSEYLLDTQPQVNLNTAIAAPREYNKPLPFTPKTINRQLPVNEVDMIDTSKGLGVSRTFFDKLKTFAEVTKNQNLIHDSTGRDVIGVAPPHIANKYGAAYTLGNPKNDHITVSGKVSNYEHPVFGETHAENTNISGKYGPVKASANQYVSGKYNANTINAGAHYPSGNLGITYKDASFGDYPIRSGLGLRGEYYDKNILGENANIAGEVSTNTDPTIGNNWHIKYEKDF